MTLNINWKVIKIAFFFVMVLICSSCQKYSKKEILSEGRKIEEVVKFSALFGESAYHNVGYLKGIGSKYGWVSKASMYERYQITMYFNLKGPNNVEKKDGFRIDVYEIVCGDDEYLEKKFKFSLNKSQWLTVVKFDDMFTIVGENCIKDRPVEGFRNLPLPKAW